MENDELTVKVSHPSGIPMAFSESLIKYLLEHRAAVATFAVGDWLESLSDTNLVSFVELATQICEGSNQHNVDDVVSVAIHAATAEKRVKQLNIGPDEIFELVGSLLHAASMECNQRNELVVVSGKMRIYPYPKDTVTLTDKGIALAERYQGLH